MFTYKFLGLNKQDAQTPYYYGSLPTKPEPGHILLFDETGNRYAVVRIAGEGLVGDGPDSQEELAWAEINRGETVPTLWLQKLDTTKVARPKGRSFDQDEVKEFSRRNRKIRLAKPPKKK